MCECRTVADKAVATPHDWLKARSTGVDFAKEKGKSDLSKSSEAQGEVNVRMSYIFLNKEREMIMPAPPYAILQTVVSLRGRDCGNISFGLPPKVPVVVNRSGESA